MSNSSLDATYVSWRECLEDPHRCLKYVAKLNLETGKIKTLKMSRLCGIILAGSGSSGVKGGC